MIALALKRLEQAVYQVLKWSSVAALLGLLVLIGAGVFVRFVPVASMGWADEVIEFGFVWIVFFGAAALWRDRTHFRVDLLPRLLAKTVLGRVLENFLNLLSLLFFVVLTYQGFLLTFQTTDDSPILALPKMFWYLIVPLAAAAMLAYTVRDLVSDWRGGEDKK